MDTRAALIERLLSDLMDDWVHNAVVDYINAAKELEVDPSTSAYQLWLVVQGQDQTPLFDTARNPVYDVQEMANAFATMLLVWGVDSQATFDDLQDYLNNVKG